MDAALEVSLKDLDPWEDPGLTVDVLTLKANAIAKIILDTLGLEKTGKLLAAVREVGKGDSQETDPSFSGFSCLEELRDMGHDFISTGDRSSQSQGTGDLCEIMVPYLQGDGAAAATLISYSLLYLTT